MSKSIPPFAALRAFEAVFRAGGIRKAASDLGISHAVISRHIKLLEEWIGEPLLVRTHRRLCLTESGSVYHDKISAALAEIAMATDEIRGHYNPKHIRLCCVPGFAFQWLSEKLAEFERRHAEFSIELRPTDTTANLLAYEADVDIRYHRDGEAALAGGKGLKVFELARPRTLAVARRDIAERLNTLDSARELLAENLIHEDNHVEWRGWLSANGVELPPQLHGPLCFHAHLAVAAARQGRGVALGSLFLVGAELAQGTLVEVATTGTRRVALGRYIFTAREDRWSSPGLTALRRFLHAEARLTTGDAT